MNVNLDGRGGVCGHSRRYFLQMPPNSWYADGEAVIEPKLA
ncbi:hypothetical protein J2T20_000511 [Paenibacillus wynnii]|nr:hypothetical protein [Paenibacillus wynnii]